MTNDTLASGPTDPPTRPKAKERCDRARYKASAACSGDRTGPGISYATCDVKLINTVYRVPIYHPENLLRFAFTSSPASERII